MNRGAQGSVIRVTHKVSGEGMAMKVVRMDTVSREWDRRALSNEATLLRTLDSPHILRMTGCAASAKHTVLILERCADTLLDRARALNWNLTDAMLRTVMSQLLKAIEHLGDAGVIHRDIKVSRLT